MGFLCGLSCSSESSKSSSASSNHRPSLNSGDAPPRYAVNPRQPDEHNNHVEHEEKTAPEVDEYATVPSHEAETGSFVRLASTRPSEPVDELTHEPEEQFGQQHLITDESIDRQASPHHISTRDVDETEEDRWFEAKDH